MKIIAMTNKKGGVGKTTTALSVAAYLGQSGFSVLAIDMDPQGNFSMASGAKQDEAGTFDFLGGAPLENCVQKMGKYTLLAADARLSKAAAAFPQIGNQYLLETALARVKGYHYVILDTSPSMDVLTLNAYTAADAVVICCQPDDFSLSGLDGLMNNLDQVKQHYNKKLSVAGILLTRYDSRTSISGRMKERFQARAKELGTSVFARVIRESVAIKESQSQHRDIFDYSATGHAAEDYAEFTKELFAAVEGNKKKWPKNLPKQNSDEKPRISISRPKPPQPRPRHHR